MKNEIVHRKRNLFQPVCGNLLCVTTGTFSHTVRNALPGSDSNFNLVLVQ